MFKLVMYGISNAILNVVKCVSKTVLCSITKRMNGIISNYSRILLYLCRIYQFGGNCCLRTDAKVKPAGPPPRIAIFFNALIDNDIAKRKNIQIMIAFRTKLLLESSRLT